MDEIIERHNVSISSSSSHNGTLRKCLISMRRELGEEYMDVLIVAPQSLAYTVLGNLPRQTS